MVNDFGHVSLEISGLRESDTGIYECRAKNNIGEAITTASITVQGKASLILESHHQEGMRKIAALETKTTNAEKQNGNEETTFGKPIFTNPLNGKSDALEGESLHMEATVVPVGDPQLTFEWTKNGEHIKLGSRMRVSQDFGYVTLDIMQCIPEDSGMYMVRAVNLAGDTSSSLAVHVGGAGGILADSMHPQSFKKVTQMEELKERKPQYEIDAPPNQPPVFMEQLNNVGGKHEGQSVNLYAKIEPKNDPALKINWEFNGKILETGDTRSG
jgi:titin